MFSGTFSGVKTLFWILQQLNIPCISSAHFTTLKITVHLLHVSLITCSPVCWISSKQSNPYINMVSTLSGVQLLFWILSQLSILCTYRVKQYYATSNKSPYTWYGDLNVHPRTGVHRSRNLAPETAVPLFPMSEAFQQKLSLQRQKIRGIDWPEARLVRLMSQISRTIKGVKDQQLKRLVIMIRT